MPAAEKQPAPARIQPSLDRFVPVVIACLQRQKPGRGRAGLYRGLAAAMSALLCTGLHCAEIPHKPACAHAAARLNPLFASLTSLPGVGPKLEKLYAHLLGREAPRVIDLLFHLPSGAIDRRARPKLRDVQPGQVVTVAVTVDEHRPSPPHRPRAPYRIYADDDTGDITLTYFNARRDYLEKLLPVGETRYVSGTAEFYDGMLQMVHPDRVVDEAGFAALPLVEPVYPLTEGLALGNVRRAMDGALDAPARPAGMAGRSLGVARALSGFRDALRHLHRPAEPARHCRPKACAWTRLAYDELLAGQLALALVRAHMRRQPGRGSAGEGRLRATHSEGAALFAHAFAAKGGRRHRRPTSPSRSACCGCCKAMSAPARPWWRCSPPPP